MAGTAVFFGIECAHCGERIPLVEVAPVPPVNGGWVLPDLDPSSVRCGRCGHQRLYRSQHLIVFSGPMPSEDFEPHRSFRAA
jgi:DNA-directed RNA polymerase subunit RPC12/RpoP